MTAQAMAYHLKRIPHYVNLSLMIIVTLMGFAAVGLYGALVIGFFGKTLFSLITYAWRQ
jgi:hypothetical protein